MLLSDKDTLINTVQASHDKHTNYIDAAEDRLVSREVRSANDVIAANAAWQAKRNRDRISEIITYVERNMVELEELEEEGDDQGGDI